MVVVVVKRSLSVKKRVSTFVKPATTSKDCPGKSATRRHWITIDQSVALANPQVAGRDRTRANGKKYARQQARHDIVNDCLRHAVDQIRAAAL